MSERLVHIAHDVDRFLCLPHTLQNQSWSTRNFGDDLDVLGLGGRLGFAGATLRCVGTGEW